MDFIISMLAKIINVLPTLDLSSYVDNLSDNMQFFVGYLNYFVPMQDIFNVGKDILLVALAYIVYMQLKRIFLATV